MEDVDEIRSKFARTGRISAEDLLFLTDRLERTLAAGNAMKIASQNYIRSLEEALATQELTKDIEIHELKEQLKQYDKKSDA
jgi:hypothetical protein